MDIAKFISDLFKTISKPEGLKTKPFSTSPINLPRGHANSSHTKKIRMDSRVKPRKCRLSKMQRKAARAR